MRTLSCMLAIVVALIGTVLVGSAGSSAWAAEGDKVKAIRDRGKLACGTSTGTNIGMSTLDNQGNWKGLEVDICHAIAAAIFGDPSKVEFVPLEFKNAFAALQSGKVDLLARGTTYVFSRDADLKFDFAGIYMYEGQGFLVAKKLGVNSALKLDGASICVVSGTTTELNLADYFRTNGIKYTPVVSATREQNYANLESGRCDAFTNDRGVLAAGRTTLAKPDDYIVLPEVISKEPTSLVVLQSDPVFTDIVRWTLYALLASEELKVTQANVKQLAAESANPEIQRMLGKTGGLGKMLGLDNAWVVDIIASVGNFGEIYDRHLGAGGPIKLDRGVNRLWSEGGLLYSPPFR